MIAQATGYDSNTPIHLLGYNAAEKTRKTPGEIEVD
jgi:hypothetical protein